MAAREMVATGSVISIWRNFRAAAQYSSSWFRAVSAFEQGREPVGRLRADAFPSAAQEKQRIKNGKGGPCTSPRTPRTPLRASRPFSCRGSGAERGA
eukprot:48413-Pyramimonas_sp.AAC.1